MRETILVIDDHDETRRLLAKYILKPAGFYVLEADNGKQGMHLALKQNPDLILLDINLPDANGMDVLRALRQTMNQSEVIFITADDSVFIAIEALRLGVQDYLLKPLMADAVLSAIRRALAHRRSEQYHEAMLRELIAAEATRQTTVALAHHINNDLTVLVGNLALLRDMLKSKEGMEESLALINDGMRSARRIASTLKSLEDTTRVKIDTYDQDTEMLHVSNK